MRDGQVRVQRQDISHLSDNAVHLADGIELQFDAFVASTGWLFGPAIDFKDKSLHSSYGLPSTEYTSDQKAFWASMDEKADAEIFRRWPKLATLKYPPQAE